jgi:hypothetical protein
MRSPSPKFLLFNAAAALAGTAAVLAAAWSVLMPTPIAPCSERYNAMTAFGLERGGVAITAADLQASVGGKDVGVIDSVTIGPVKDAPAPLAMAVSLRTASVSAQGITTRLAGGTSFPWQPRALKGKASACLSYHVLLPTDLEFQGGGVLPGIAGTDGKEQGDKFAVQLAWRPNQGGGVNVRVTENGVSSGMPVERRAFELARGRWTKVEQEVILNTPKLEDGTLRVWVDGALVVDRRDIAYRTRPEVTVAGVAVDVFRGTGPVDTQAAASKDAKVWLTPFAVRWQ